MKFPYFFLDLRRDVLQRERVERRAKQWRQRIPQRQPSGSAHDRRKVRRWAAQAIYRSMSRFDPSNPINWGVA